MYINVWIIIDGMRIIKVFLIDWVYFKILFVSLKFLIEKCFGIYIMFGLRRFILFLNVLFIKNRIGYKRI